MATSLLAPRDLKKIQRVLAATLKTSGNSVRFEVAAGQPGRTLALEVYPHLTIGDRKGSLVTVYTANAHLQLHFCTGFVASELLGEVTFVGESNGKLSGLTVEREGGCSLYANVDRSMLSGDFTKLGPEVMLSGVALSLTEELMSKSSARTERTNTRRPRTRAGRKVR
ncbi:MAG: hypothetical protein MUE68_06525 [Bacteroidetes bacterium]|jgi:hypothetical protein|nr:hypothetical protein [Bacteroidota bacterium]